MRKLNCLIFQAIHSQKILPYIISLTFQNEEDDFLKIELVHISSNSQKSLSFVLYYNPYCQPPPTPPQTFQKEENDLFDILEC